MVLPGSVQIGIWVIASLLSVGAAGYALAHAGAGRRTLIVACCGLVLIYGAAAVFFTSGISLFSTSGVSMLRASSNPRPNQSPAPVGDQTMRPATDAWLRFQSDAGDSSEAVRASCGLSPSRTSRFEAITTGSRRQRLGRATPGSCGFARRVMECFESRPLRTQSGRLS